MNGRTVKIFLVNGIPGGLITAEIMNWTGKFTVGSRLQLPDLLARPELQKPGIYFLTGSNPEDPSQEVVYIGESGNIGIRLGQHNSNPANDFWEKTIVVTSKDENLTGAHCLYLESKLIQKTRLANRVVIKNVTNPENPNLPESDVADMEGFLEHILIVLPVLGYTFANPLPVVLPVQNNQTSDQSSPIFTMAYSGANATAQEINGEFVILQGSLARKNHAPSLADSYIHMRQKLVQEQKLVDSQNNGFWSFTQNVPFQSPSTAANVVGGASINGRQQWKVEGTLKTYASWAEERIERVEETTDTITAEEN